MSEQKYYVKLRQEVFIADRCGHGGIICHTWLSEDYDFSEELFRQAFTKSELDKIMDGAFYHVSDDKCDYCRYSSDTCVDEHCEEWINPLIELVPVEEVEP